MSRRAVLWIAFAVVHLGVGWLGWVLPNQPMGDVYNVYGPWSAQALAGRGIVGVDETWVYPQLALIPMILAQGLAWIAGYTVGWAILVTLVDAAAFVLLVGGGNSTGRNVAAWFWLSYIALLGPVGMYRLDGFTVPIVIAACLWLVGRPWLASILLAAATWMKVWPAAILAAAVIAVRRRLVLIAGGLIVSAATVIVVIAAGGAVHAFGFVTDQTGRGLQVEAPVSMPFLWGAVWGVEGARVYYAPDIVTFQVTGTSVDQVIAAMTPVLVVAVGAVAVLGAVVVARGAHFARVFPTLSLALVTAFIVFNKVGSPQYLCWLIPPIVVGLVIERRRWTAPATLALAAALLTQLIYPLVYGWVLAAAPVPVLILTLRNLVLIALFAWMTVRLVRMTRTRAGTRVRPLVTEAA